LPHRSKSRTGIAMGRSTAVAARDRFMHELRVNFLNARFMNRRPITRTFF
jgi:hypothetical protein